MQTSTIVDHLVLANHIVKKASHGCAFVGGTPARVFSRPPAGVRIQAASYRSKPSTPIDHPCSIPGLPPYQHDEFELNASSRNSMNFRGPSTRRPIIE